MMAEQDEGEQARAQQLIGSLTGVVDARIVTNREGDIDEIHVLSDPSVGGKQVVRNVESALLAELGLEIDHRKVSVAHLQEAPAAAPTEESQEARAGTVEKARIELLEFELKRRAGDAVSCRVTLTKNDKQAEGTAEGADSAPSRLSTAASAVIKALQGLVESELRLATETVQRQEVGGRDVVVTVVLARQRRSTAVLCGAALIADGAEEAAALACLDALNRWLGGQG